MRHTRPPRTTLLLCAALATLTCGGDTGSTPEPNPTLGLATLFRVADVGNDADAGDLQVQLRLPTSAEGIQEYRILLQPSAAGAVLAVAGALALPSERSYSIAVQGAETTHRLPATLPDTEGDAIEEGVAYRLYVLTVATTASGLESRISSPSEVTLERTDIVRTLTGSIDVGSGGMDVDAAGNVYAADFGATLNGGGDRIVRMTPDGQVSTWATGFSGASGNDFGSNGDLFQSNITVSRIDRVAPDGTRTEFTSETLTQPVGIAVAPGDTLYVVNCGDQSISKVAPDGSAEIFVRSSQMSCPNGITLADDGNLYVANFSSSAILRVGPVGDVSQLATMPGFNNGHILFGNGVLYVAARGLNQIYQVTLDGEVTLLAGTGERGLADGPALSATLSLTNDVALSPDGRILYFNDVARSTGAPSTISPVVIRALILDASGPQAVGPPR